MGSPTFYIYPFGCQMNRHEAETLSGTLVKRGYIEMPSVEGAEIVLYMSCSVRDKAENRVWSHLGAWRSKKKSAGIKVLGLLGCMAERVGAKVTKRMKHVDLVAGPRQLGSVPEILDQLLGGHEPIVTTGKQMVNEDLDPSLASRPKDFQAMLAVMHGCDGGCSYCIVPRVRGRERSVPFDEVISSFTKLVEKGAKEITLLGQNIDRYGFDLPPEFTFARLVERLAETPALERLRFVTSNPHDINEELLNVMAANKVISPYLHIPAQSGSNRILGAMNRGYTRERYLEVVNMARNILPEVELASDFIVGFPTETDEEFQETVSLMKEVRFQNAFLFKYSPRPSTPAARLEDDIPDEVKRARHQEISALQMAIQTERHKEFEGSTVSVLTEGISKGDAARYAGRTATGRIVAFAAPRDTTGKIVNVKIEETTPLVLLGKQVE